MDSVVKVRRSFMNRIRGFCNIFAGMCSGCCRRPCCCALTEEIHLAKTLIVEIDHVRDADEERYYVDNPMEEFLARIVKAVSQAGKPIRSNEIRTPDASRQRKARAISTLVRRHRLVRTVVDGTPFYSIPSDGIETTTTTTTTTTTKQGN